jgi:RimJ/RimL family protein N-acetyltransferase
LETARLSLRRFTNEDVGRYHLLTGNARVMRFVTGHPFTWEETEAKFARILARNSEHEHEGIWALYERSTGEFVGSAALMREPSGRVELGYRIVEERWGQGFATEAAEALLRLAVSALRAREVVAYVEAGNGASIRVLEKLGMRRSSSHEEGGRLEHEYLWRVD